MKLNNSNCYETQKLKLWWNSKTHYCDATKNLKLWQNLTQIVMKLKNSYYDETQKQKLWSLKLKWRQNSKTQFVTTQKLKLWQNSKCEKKTLIVTKLKTWRKKLKMWQNSDCDKPQELKLWKNSKTQNVKIFRLGYFNIWFCSSGRGAIHYSFSFDYIIYIILYNLSIFIKKFSFLLVTNVLWCH